MRRLRIVTPLGALGAFLLTLGLEAGPARAAATVDVTYDLSDSTLVWDGSFRNKLPVNNADWSENGTISGRMKVRYVSNSSSGMPIVHDAATLLTFNLTASIRLYSFFQYPAGARHGFYTYLSGVLHWQLTTPVSGNLTSGGMLTGITANLLMTGHARCAHAYTPYCIYVGVPTFTIYPHYSRSGAINVAGSAGPYGGAQSTRHTLTGRAPAIGWLPGGFRTLGLGSEFYPYDDYGGAHLVGREILREAEGHPPKVPEPGTLLLLGAGTVGLALVGRATRRSRHH